MSTSISAVSTNTSLSASRPRELPVWFVPVLGGLVIEVFLLICLGGSVRIMNAGLACPDWPLCFGDYIPDYHPQVYFEFIHRVMAGLVSLTTLALAVALWMSSVSRALKWLMTIAVLLLLAQVVFGGLTVLWQLEAGVVATHLGMGTAFFGMLLWIYLRVKPAPASPPQGPRWLAGVAGFMMIAIYGQILLGGMVASHYAALVCPDFPSCQGGQWFPTFSGMVGLQVIHRLGAYSVCAFASVAWWLIRRYSASTRLHRLADGVLALIVVQIGLGIANVLLRTPALIGVLHLATATAIFSLTIRQLHLFRLTDEEAMSLQSFRNHQPAGDFEK